MAGALAVSAAFTATDADALFLDGVFNINIYNYDAGGVRANAAATAANLSSAGSAIATVEYTGALRCGINVGTPTISAFLDTCGETVGSGSWTQTAGTAGVLDSTTLSAGTFTTTTLFDISAVSFSNIANLSQIDNVRHDDGILLTDGTTVITNTPPGDPTTAINTGVSGLLGGAGEFSLLYAAANSDPSILEVSVVPLPAAAWLLLGVSGALVAAKRRSARRDA
jgi:hypothetical protein